MEMLNNTETNVELNTNEMIVSKGGFDFLYKPSGPRATDTTHYLHVFKDGVQLTPKGVGVFVKNNGKYGDLTITDRSYEIPLIHVIQEYFAPINAIKFIKPSSIKDKRGIKKTSGETIVVWRRV
jgi:hypothetical protein